MTPKEIRFLRALAHELRNVFAPIRNAAAIVQWKGAGDPQVSQSVATIQSQVEAGVQLLNKLRDAVLLESGEFAIAAEPALLSEVLDAAVSRARLLAQSKRQHIAYEGLGEDCTFAADAEQLSQALFELLSNACKFSPEAAVIALGVRVDEDSIAIQVHDPGVGMPPERLASACEPLSRFAELVRMEEIDASYADDGATPGLGMGLAVAAQVVRLHGGRLTLESRGPGMGCVAHVVVPRRPAETTEDAAPGAVRRPVHRILVVDDAARVRETLSSLLQDWGYEVSAAAGGEEALAAVRADPPDMVLLDLHMPGLSGFDVARMLRREPAADALALVLLSGEDLTPALREGARAAGFDDWIDKAASVQAWEELFSRLSRRRGAAG